MSKTTQLEVQPTGEHVDGHVAEGQTLGGRYLLHERLGQGGMATVFLAEDLRLRREIAIKVALPVLARDPQARRWFLREAESMARVRHPNVIEIYDVGDVGDTPYLVMPYLHGANLEAWAERRGGVPVPSDVAIGVMGQACAGVAALHAAGLVHRDIKPSNILVLESFEVVVADLGLTHLAGGITPGPLSGTPGFMAPELIASRGLAPELAARVDVYALGVTGYWLLTGRLPTSGQLLDRVHGGPPSAIEPPSELRPELPAAFDAPLLAALADDPALRPTASELREQLLVARDTTRALPSGQAPFVVVVDDDELALAFVEEVVREALPGAELACLRDPRAALSIIESRPPSLIITDLQMPQLNGVELTAAVQARDDTRNTPIIVLTAVGSAADWTLLRTLGATRFLVKPLDPSMLFDTVRRVMGHRS